MKSIAWATAMLSRAKDMPSYNEWMGKGGSKRTADPEELAERKAQHEQLVSSYESYRASKKEEVETVGN